jgi:uncharacterized membrane protein YhdT
LSFFGELKRRNVYRVGVAYLIAACVIAQVVSVLSQPLGLPTWFDAAVAILLAAGFPVALLFAWAYELTPAGLKPTGEVSIDKSAAEATGRKFNHLLIGGFERPDAMGSGFGRWGTAAGRDWLIQVHQDIRRTLDYLETRTDIDRNAIGFYGLSLGGMLAPQPLAIEARFRAAIVTVTGVISD